MSDMNKSLLVFNGIIKENGKQYRDAAKLLGISDCVFWILYSLRETKENLTQKEIGDTAFMPPQTINSALKKLEAGGYVELRNDSDKRSKQVYLTEKGDILAQKTVDKVIAIEMRAVNGMTEEEQLVFLKLFQKYTDLLKIHIYALKKEP